MKKQILCEIEYSPTWDEGVRYYRDSINIILTSQDNLYGLEMYGKEILPIEYSSISLFYKRDDYKDVVSWFLIEKDSKYGLLKCNEQASIFSLEVIYDKIEKTDRFGTDSNWPDIFGVLDIICEGKHGRYDIYKGLLVPCLYDEIIGSTDYFIVVQDGLKGAYFNDKMIIPCLYDNIENRNIVVKNGRKGLYAAGKEVVQPIYEDIKFFAIQSHNQRNHQIYRTFTNHLVGLCDIKGEICSPMYDEIIEEYSIGVTIKKGKLIGCYTEKNKIIEPQFDDIKRLSPQYYAYSQQGRWGVFNDEGDIIINPIYDEVKLLGSARFSVLIDNKWGLVDLHGEYIASAKFDVIEIMGKTIYARIGRKMYVLKNDTEFLKTFWSDRSCGYIDKSSVLEYDSNLENLFNVNEPVKSNSSNDAIAIDELPF